MNVKQKISKLCEKFFLVPNYSHIAVWLSSLAVVSLNHWENQKCLHKSLVIQNPLRFAAIVQKIRIKNDDYNSKTDFQDTLP